MRKDTSFLERKLTNEEFAKKYWLNGEAPYQYHTVEIEDGRDEREQLTINNIRALWERYRLQAKYNEQARGSIRKKIKKMTILAVTSIVISGIVLITCALLYFLK